jgi:hypothetical protein
MSIVLEYKIRKKNLDSAIVQASKLVLAQAGI